jgi:hypothetical protein
VADVEPEEGELSVSFDGRLVTYGFGELDALVPAYAASIHKSQGSEYPAVVIPVMTDAALRHVAAEPCLHGRHARQAACRSGSAEEGCRYCCAERLGPAALVEAGEMVERGRLEALCEFMMSGVTVPPWRSRFYLASGRVGNKSIASFQACTRHVH